MKKIIYFSILAIGLFFISCKKESGTSPGGGSNSGSTTITPSSATSYNAIFTIYSIQTCVGTTLGSVFKSCVAYFSSSPTPGTNSSTFVKVNSVSLNNVGFKFSTYQYQDTTGTIVLPPSTWQVNGLGAIPSFSFTNNNAIPTYTGYASLPDTVYKSQSITIPITGVTGSDEVFVIISDLSNLPGHNAVQVLGTSATSVTFSPTTLASINVTNSASITVYCNKNNVQNVYGVPMSFVNNYQLNKTISIK